MAQNKPTVTKNVILRSNFKTKQQEFKCRPQDILNKSEEYCERESENPAVKGNTVVSESKNGESHVTNELTEEAEENSSSSQSNHKCKFSKTYKTYKSQLQPIAKGFQTFGSNKKSINNDSSEPEETLRDSSQDSSQCSNGVLKVSTKSSIDLCETRLGRFLLDICYESPFQKSENSERFRTNDSLILTKRSNEKCSKWQSSKKAKADDKRNVIKEAQWSSQLSKLSFEFSDEEEEKEYLTNGNEKSPTMYLCKHCDYSEVTIAQMHSHFDHDHPYVRYDTSYIQDLCDQSATFRCLECHVEFLSVLDLQRHYRENHPEGPDFQNTSSQLHLVHKCIGCSYTTEDLSRTHSYPNDDMKSQFSDSKVPSLERARKTEIQHSSTPECPTSSISADNDCKKSPEQSACVTSGLTLQIPAKRSSGSVTCENIFHFPKQTKTGEVMLSLNPQNTPEASKSHAELKATSEAVKPAGDVSQVEKSPAILTVAGHQNAKQMAQQSSIQSKVMLYNSKEKEKLQSKAETPISTPDSERGKQVCRNRDQRPKMDQASDLRLTGLNPYSRAENLFYCHICNYGGQSPTAVVMHQAHSHSQRIASVERVNNYTALIREEMKKSPLEVNNASFSCNLPLPILLKNEKQVFFCHLCNSRRRTLRKVLHHCTLKHRRVTVSAKEVERYTSMVLQKRSEPLEKITGQEDDQLHGKEEVPRTKTGLEKHKAATKQQRSLQRCRVQEQHPDQNISHKDVNAQLHAAPESASPKSKKSKDVPLIFHTYQVPLEFDTSPGSLACVSPENLKCSSCAATFPTQDCPDTHCVHKHKGDPREKDVSHTHEHFHICPHCPYVNIKDQGVLSHCRRKHPVLSPGADRFSVDQTYSNNCEESMEMKGSARERGYICKICSQLWATMKKLNRHIHEAHISAEASPESRQSKRAQLSDVSAKNREHLSSPPKSGPKVSLSNEVNKYIASALKSQECFYTCALCPQFYSSRKDLGEHVEKHGREAFSKYWACLEHSHSTSTACEALEEGECSQGFVPAAVSSPSVSNSEMSPGQRSPRTEPEPQKHLECKVCPKVTFDSAEQLIFHYSTRHFSARMLDFIVLRQVSEKSSGLYRCSLCQKQVSGIQKMLHHLDGHRGGTEQAGESPDRTVSVDPPLIKPATQDFGQNHQPVFEDVAQRNETPVETTAPPSPPSSLLKPAGPEQPKLEPEKDRGAGFVSPHVCTSTDFSDAIIDPVETANQGEERSVKVNEGHPASTQAQSNASAPHGKAEVNEEPPHSEPPDVQQESNHICLKAEGHAVFEDNWKEATLLHCELCQFNTQHLPDMQQHLQQWHGKQMLRCPDCSFVTVLRKTLNIHIETSHSACLSEPNHVKDFHCPFCLFLSKNKDTMIDHIISHREAPVVPGEASPPKLSRDLLGTFTSGAAENLHLRVMEHEDVRPYRCRLCYFDCTQPRGLEAHLTDNHHVIRNHELVSELVLQQEARVSRVSEEPWADTQVHSRENLDVTMHGREAKSQGEDDIGEDVPQIYDPNGEGEFPSKSSVLDLQTEHERGHRIENTQQKRKAEVGEEAQVNQLCMKKQRVLQKSDGNLPLRIKGRH